MRTTLIIILTLGLMSANGQYLNLKIDFDNQSLLNHVFIDTVSNPDNIWQIGIPQKTIFNQSYSIPNGIITDTIGYYPLQDTSSFIIKFAWTEYLTQVSLKGYYKFDSDTLMDYGTIEISLDNGLSWSNVLEDPIIPDWAWYPEKPVFTGTINNWQYFSVSPSNFYPINLGDSIYYKFTFISDEIQTNKEGWLLDDLQLIELSEGEREIPETNPDFLVYPNPVIGYLTIELKNVKDTYDFRIYDITGKQLISKNGITESKIRIDCEEFKTGLYFYAIDFKNQKDLFGKVMKQ